MAEYYKRVIIEEPKLLRHQADTEDTPDVYVRYEPAADVVEVCRCRDCMYWQSGENDAEKWEWCIFHKHSLGPHGFCNYGERRSE